MRKLDLVLVLCSTFALSIACSSDDDNNSGAGGSAAGGASAGGAGAGGAGGKDASVGTDTGTAADTAVGDAAPDDAAAAGDAAVDGGGAGDDGGADAGPSAQALRGKYVVGVLGCGNCHTPKVAGTSMADATMLLAGVDCFVSTPGCLSSGNLTPDMETGIGAFSDQAIIDAFRTGKEPDPDAAGKFLFARMPYYQFANLSDDDAHAIVAYLRSLPPVKHAVKEPTATFMNAPTSPEWTPVDPAKLPAPGASAPADAANGKYLATLMCVTCHSADATGMPKHVDEATAFQGGQSATITPMGGMPAMFQSANLTPDMTGLKAWTATDIVTAIKTAKDRMGKTLCAPMRANAAITDADATSIADYLMSIPPVAHMVNACTVRM
jgi:cytochrome c553